MNPIRPANPGTAPGSGGDAGADPPLDAAFAAYFASALDPVAGNAGPAFRAALRTRRLSLAWRWGAVAAGAAAAVVLWALVGPRGNPGGPAPQRPQLATTSPGTGPLALPAGPASEPTPIFRAASFSPVVDDGLGLADDRPVRRLRRRVVEEVEWYDPRQNALIRATRPAEQVILIGLRSD